MLETLNNFKRRFTDNPKNNDEVSARLHVVEAVLELSVKSMQSQMNEVLTEVRSLKSIQNENSKPNYTPIAWALSFGFSITVALITGYIGIPVNGLANEIDLLKANQIEMSGLVKDRFAYNEAAFTEVKTIQSLKLSKFESDIRELKKDRVKISNDSVRHDERIFNIERELYKDSDIKYRAGRPVD